MNITIHTLEIDGTQLSLKVARQFPILPYNTRWDESVQHEPQRAALGKVLDHTLDRDFSAVHPSYFILVQYDDGPKWVRPVLMTGTSIASMTAHGMWWDDLSTIPLIILK